MRISDWSSDVCSSDLEGASRTRTEERQKTRWQGGTLKIGTEGAGKGTKRAKGCCRAQGNTETARENAGKGARHGKGRRGSGCEAIQGAVGRCRHPAGSLVHAASADRQSVVSGKQVAVRVVLGGHRII